MISIYASQTKKLSYISPGRNEEKSIPTTKFETEEETYISQKSTWSRKYATSKVMQTGIICPVTKFPNNLEIPNDWQNSKIEIIQTSFYKNVSH